MLDFTIIEAGSDYQPTTGHVTSVNGHTGAVTLQIEDIPNLATSIQTINQNLQHKAEKTTVEALSNRVDGFESAINSKAAQTDLNTLSGRLDDAEDDIGALEDELEAKASTSDLNDLGDRVTTAEGNIINLSNDKANNSDLNTTNSKVNSVNTKADNNRYKCDNIIGADAYSSNVNYSPGDMCIYSNTAWKCLIACQDETPEEGTYWTQVSLKSLEYKTSVKIANISPLLDLVNYSVKKSGNVVSVNFTVSTSSSGAIEGNTTFFNIPEGFRPSATMTWPIQFTYNRSAEITDTARLAIFTSGDVKMSFTGSISTGKYAFFTCSYII